MKKIIYLTLIIVIGVSFQACNPDELLEKPPLDSISDPLFWNSESDLELFLNKFYNSFDGWSRVGTGFATIKDNHTDVSIYTQPSNRLDGAAVVPVRSNTSNWNWSNIRNVNYFLENASRAGDGPLVDHLIGEGHFFRAWFYFLNFKKYGALPIINKTIADDDEEALYAPRNSRTEVMDFILNDLDLAISKMRTKGELSAQRLNIDVARLFKARVALFAGTWEKHHSGTVFAGSTDGKGYLRQAADAAKAVIDGGRYSLVRGNPTEVYYELFNNIDYSNNPEVLFYKHYDFVAYGNTFGNDLQRWPNRSGITLDMVNSYLCSDGLPIAVSPLYQGNLSLNDVTTNRDPRCVQSIMTPGDVQTINGEVTNLFTAPNLGGDNGCPTAYEYQKFRNPEVDPATGAESKNTGFIHFRLAEALLIYAESKGELGTINQSDLDLSINELRDRVGMPHLTLGAITVDPNWPDYGYTLPDYMYEIRRERQVELLGEGRRFEDILRWRAHALIVGKSPKGAYYSDDLKAINANLKVDSDGYLEPFQGNLSGPNGGYNFDPNRDYLQALPLNELELNANLTQNPGW